MTQEELYSLLETTGYPVAYYSFKASNINPIPDPPYIIYLFLSSDNFGADNQVFYKTDNFRVELYSDNKDIEAETTIENTLDSASLFYNKEETYIDSEQLFLVAYNINI